MILSTFTNNEDFLIPFILTLKLGEFHFPQIQYL